jgi:ribose/xylose/arabinose/galactoside ABC-type transport system permease subunit
MLVASGVWVALALAAALALMLRFTVLGRHIFAIGSNEAAARLCGINVRRVKLTVYALAGLFAGIAGIYNFSELSQGDPTSGMGFELRVIAAVVIGGASLSGGRGSVLGALTGAALMATITSGCTQLGLPNPIQDIIVGLIIVAAVTVDQLRQRRLRAA